MSDFKKYIKQLDTTERRCKKMEKKQLTEKQQQLLIKLIVAAISFILGLAGQESEILSKVTEFVQGLI